MKINIIGCGPSGKLWDGKGDSIGVNDCLKFGFHPDILVLLNSPNKFTKERLDLIAATNSKRVITHITQWRKYFGQRVERIDYKTWNGTLEKEMIYVSNTSPFCALSIAYNLGYTEMLLYGVDFTDHPTWNPQNINFSQEREQYHSFVKVLGKNGVSVYSITDGELDLPIKGKDSDDVMKTLYV